MRDVITGGDMGFMTAEQLREKYGLLETHWKYVANKQALPDIEKGLLFDFYASETDGKWTPWMNMIKGMNQEIADGTQFHNIIVSTGDTVRNGYFMGILSQCSKHVLFQGVTGTGKTVSVNNMLLSGFPEEQFTSMSFAFSAATSSKQTQDIIDGKVDKRRRGVFGPPVGKQMMVFVDDLNMPAKEEYGAQPPLELLRQYMCVRGWYDRKTNEFRQLEDLLFIGAMGPPGGGKNHIPARYLWHYNLMYITPYSTDSLSRIFTTIMKWFLRPFASSVSGQVNQVIAASVDMYEGAQKLLRPTPTKSHYTFNLRDLSKIFQGITLCTKESLPDVDALARCWSHECSRIFMDRLVNDEDKGIFNDLLKSKLEEHFKKKWDALVKVEPLIFTEFVSPRGTYEEVKDHDGLIAKAQELLNDYNAIAKHEMNLVLFLSFVSHITKVVRVLRLPLGNVLAVGVGGSGRKSVATLASSIVEYEVFQIEISKSYGMTDWHEDLKSLLMSVGCKAKQTTFLFTDTQVQQESFLEDISSILNTGEVPNLYNSEDKGMIQDSCAKAAGQEGKMGPAAVFAWYVGQCKKFLHIVLCLSPIGDAFRSRLRNYPSVVNCCTIDWFLQWPQEALHGVARQFLKETCEDKPEIYDGIVNTCVAMQNGVYALTERYRSELRRHYYVTPTSYLELINCFKGLLGKKEDEVSTAKSRYDVGLEKIVHTEGLVEGMQKELTDLQPVLEVMTKENNEMMVVIEKESKEAAITKGIVQVEEAAANKLGAEATEMKESCQKDLDEALPAFNSAMAALKNLSKGDITEVKSMKNPPSGVVLVSEALCHMFTVEPKIIKDPNGPGKTKDYWTPAKEKIFGDTNLLNKLLTYSIKIK